MNDKDVKVIARLRKRALLCSDVAAHVDAAIAAKGRESRRTHWTEVWDMVGEIVREVEADKAAAALKPSAHDMRLVVHSVRIHGGRATTEQIVKASKLSERRAVDALKAAGCTRQRCRVDGERAYRWVAPE